jgi:CDGSH iron-sulfur domain-containing protein 3
MMSEPVRASDTPLGVDVEEGKNYFWCACGKSQSQPFCDGAHKDTDFTPVKYTAEASRKVFFCGCKITGSQPMCDGSHNKEG